MTSGDAVVLSAISFRWHPTAAPVIEVEAWRVGRGEMVFIHGPSGSGKSTLLGLVGGVLRPQRGEVTVLGQTLGALGRGACDQFRADNVGFIFQQFNLLPYLSALENVLLPCRLSRRRAERAAATHGGAKAAAVALLQALGLDEPSWSAKPGELSVGQQQRVAAARALIGDPGIVIADEPTSALDANWRDEFMTIVVRECRRRGSTLMFVSHDQALRMHFDRVASTEELGARPCRG